MKKKILFIGDSITDCGRDYSDIESLGNGYVNILYNGFLKYNYTVINKGIAGNKVADILNRIEKDCIDLKPDLVSILIGINDVWHFMNLDYYDIKAEMERFERVYRDITEKIKSSGIENIFIIEPFVLPYPEDRKMWRNDIDKRIQIIRNIAKEYKCKFVSIDGLINECGINEEFSKYSEDGVHPTIDGHNVIAENWISNFKMYKDIIFVD